MNKKNFMKNLTAEAILADRAKRQQVRDEIEKLRRENENSETSEEDEIFKKYPFKSSDSEANDLNFTFKNYGHTIFNESTLLSVDSILKPIEENDRYLFTVLFSDQFWRKLSSHFADRPYDIAKIIFTLMANSSKHADLCKRYLLSDFCSWVPSYKDIIEVMHCWGVSQDYLTVEEQPVGFEMECEGSEQSCSQNSCSMSGTQCTLSCETYNSSKMSADLIEPILMTLEYFSLLFEKSNMSSSDTLNLVLLLLKVSVDKNCSEALPLIGIVVNTLLNSLPDFDDVLVNNLAHRLLQFETDTVNKVFISLNAIPNSHRGHQLATRFSFLIIQNILRIKTQDEPINIQSILKIFKKHFDKVKKMNPANIYFFVLSLTNIIAGLNVSDLDTNELSELLDYIRDIKKLPQIQKRDSNLKFISNFVEWCINFWSFTLVNKQELQRFASPKKISRTSSR